MTTSSAKSYSIFKGFTLRWSESHQKWTMPGLATDKVEQLHVAGRFQVWKIKHSGYKPRFGSWVNGTVEYILVKVAKHKGELYIAEVWDQAEPAHNWRSVLKAMKLQANELKKMDRKNRGN